MPESVEILFCETITNSNRASEAAFTLPVHDAVIEKQLAYGVSEMILTISKMCDGSP